jgi:hypothetical protein
MAGTRAKPELRTVTIAIVRDGNEVQAMQSKLKVAGIESFLTSERSYAVKKAHGLGRHGSPPGKEKGAVKVQVARGDVQRALGVLGATSATAPAPAQAGRAQAAGRRSRQSIPSLLKDRDPTVPVIVVVFILVAALILSIS